LADAWVALDLEMTGQDYERDEIIQIGAVRFDEGRVLDRWHTLVKPSGAVPLRISRLTGLRTRDLKGAPALSEVAPTLRRFVGPHPLVGHSVGHDVRFLASKGLGLLNPVYDTWELSTLLLPALPAYSLEGVARSVGVRIPRSHDALADAEVSRQVFLHLLERLRELPPGLLREVVELTEATGWELRALLESLVSNGATRGTSGAPPGSIRAQLLAKGVSEVDVRSALLAPPERVPPLEPAAERAPLDPDELAEAFSSGGALGRTFAEYEERPQQVEMMRAVAMVFNEGGTLVVEAGTGTGKSLAYLLPAARWALANGERVVVSTDTINLQDQLYNKDIPDIRRALGPAGKRLRATLLKGRANYLCLRRWEQFRRAERLSPDEVRFVVKVMLWLPHTRTGDVAELPLSQEERQHWLKVCATRETCTGRRCQHDGGRQCFLARARQEAEGAHLLVVNHSLLLSDMVADNTVLPEYRYLVIDEAHNLEGEATDQLGFSADLRRLHEHLDRISKPVGADRQEGLASTLPTHLRGSRAPSEAAKRVLELSQGLAERSARARARADEFFVSLSPVLLEFRKGKATDAQPQYDERYRLTAPVREGQGWGHALAGWDNLKLALLDLQAAVQEAGQLIEGLEGLNVLGFDELLAELQGLAVDHRALLDRLDVVVAKPREQDVCWLTLSARTGTVSLHQAPLHVGPLLSEGLWEKKQAVALTSATLSVDRSFQYTEERLGLHEPVRLLVGSPFDYRESALLLVPTDLPEPGNAGYQKALEALLVELTTAAQGRTLALFTSHSAVRLTQKGVQRPLAQQDILVLAHGDGPRHRLLQQFKAHPRTALLGTRSFWEGVDVVGDALSLLIIAKLPFEVPTDPVFVARSESFEEPFTEYAVPQAILRLKQGFGRLIRSKNDRGVAAVLDRRLLTKSYGGAFLRSLPGCALRKGPSRLLASEVERWLSVGAEVESSARG
jgi:DNA polymerase-3 subunit epsilon/ATP-dependent DNA helicase DinG